MKPDPSDKPADGDEIRFTTGRPGVGGEGKLGAGEPSAGTSRFGTSRPIVPIPESAAFLPSSNLEFLFILPEG
jgi:hypothetical protein